MRTVLILVFLIFGLIVGLYLLGKETHLFSKAAPATAPVEMKISNVSDNSITVSWLTQDPSRGFVEFGLNETLGQVASDDRDSTSPTTRQTHHVTFKKLKPAAVYYFKVHSGPDTYDNNGKPYQQVTSPTVDIPPTLPEPFFGTISKTGGGVPEEALVYLNFGSGSLLSTFVRPDGNWLITLNNARSADLDSYLSPKDDDVIIFSVRAGKDGKADMQAQASQRQTLSAVTLIPLSREASSSAKLGLSDLWGIIKANFGKTGQGIAGDLNGDGVVNSLDYATAVRQNTSP